MRYMKYKPSAFFANFSLSDLVKAAGLKADENFGGGGGIGGGASGGGGDHSGSGRPNKSQYHQSGSYSFQLAADERERTSESEIISSLRAQVLKEIARRGAVVRDKGEAHPAHLYVEYMEEGIEGRVEISVKLSERGCTAQATLTETTSSTREPAVDAGRHERRKPSGDYHVVAFTQDDVRGSTNAFLDSGRAAFEASMERLRRRLRSADRSEQGSVIKGLPQAEVYALMRVPPEMLKRVEESLGQKFDVPEEYDPYGRVYFLNEAALKMYRRAGEIFDVLKIVPAEEVSKMASPTLRGPYLSEEE